MVINVAILCGFLGLYSFITTHKHAVVLSAQTSDSTVSIGAVRWSPRNLSTRHFRNGDSILHARTKEQWIRAYETNTPAWCYYDDDSTNLRSYGCLYNIHAVKDKRGLAPKGWRIPETNDWIATFKAIREYDKCGIRRSMQSRYGWNSNGIDAFGFKALPSGYRDGRGIYDGARERCLWWRVTGKSNVRDQIDSLCEAPYIWFEESIQFYDLSVVIARPSFGLSVRCVKE